MTKVVEKQVKSSLDVIVKELQKKIDAMQSAFSGMTLKMPEFDKTRSMVEGVMQISTAFDEAGKASGQIVSGFDRAGNKIKEVYEDGQRIKTTIVEIGGKASEINKVNEHQANIKKSMSDINALEMKKVGVDPNSDYGRELDRQIALLRERQKEEERVLNGLASSKEKTQALAAIEEKRLELANKLSLSQSRSRAKESVAPEKEILDILTKQAKIKEEIFRIDKLSLSASEGEKASLGVRKAALEAEHNALEQTVQSIYQQNDGLRESEKVQNKINSNIQKEMSNRQTLQKLTAKQTQEEKARIKTLDQIKRTLTSLVTVYAANAVKEFWKGSLDYAQKYYDKLNEIRIVTGMSESAADHLGEAYRNMAGEMSVSSTEIAEAATEFWRQGQSEEEVNERLRYTTMYAKISGLAFEEAAELVTAATNSMSLDAKRVADVFAYLGDASASGADEIGVAMQRASATADEAGVSFEWLGAYIATISEKTRQAPESIGTALNSIMSRIQSIKQKGFNEEDETKINDVAKALNSVGIALMGQDGEWRNLSDIFLEISQRWSHMDDKARAYLATTMAGARQKNVFLTLMNDMSNATGTTEEASRAMELYAGALDAAGTAAEKYGIWQESVTAAQGGFNAQVERLQSVLLNPEWLINFYNLMGSTVGVITDGTNAMGGMNILIPGLIGGIIGLSGVIGALATAAGGASITLGSLWTLMQAHPIGMAIGVFGVLATALTAIGSAFDTEATDISKSMETITGNLDSIRTAQNNLVRESSNIQNLITRYSQLTTSTSLTVEEEVELKQVISDILTLCPSLKGVLDNTSGSYMYQAEVVSALNKEIQNLNKTRQQEIREAADANLSVLAETDDELYKKTPHEKYLNGYKVFREVLMGQGYSDSEVAKRAAEEIYNTYVRKYDNAPVGARDQEFEELKGLKDFIQSLSPDKNLGFHDVNYINTLAGYLEENWTLIDDEIAAHQERINQYHEDVQETLMAYMDLSGIESETLKEGTRMQVEGILGALNLEDGVDTKELAKARSEILRTVEEMEDYEDRMLKQSDEKGSPLFSQIDAARKLLDEKKTLETLENYNKLVREWNAAAGDNHAKFSELDESYLGIGEAATTAAEGIGEVAEAEKSYWEIYQRRKAVMDQQKDGYSIILENLKKASTDASGSFNYGSMSKFLEDLEKKTPELAEAFIGDYGPYLAEFADDVGKTSEEVFAEAIAYSDKLKQHYSDVYSEVGEIVSTSFEAVEGTASKSDPIWGTLSSLLETYMNQEGFDAQSFDGVGLITEALSTLGVESGALFDQIMGYLNEVTAGTMTWNDVLYTFNEYIYGTTENVKSWLDALLSDKKFGSDEGLEFINRLKESLGDSEAMESFVKSWNELSEDYQDMIREMVDENDEWLDAVAETGDVTDETVKDINKSYRKLKTKDLVDAGKVWKEVGETIEEFDETYEKAPEQMAESFGELEQRFIDLADARTALAKAQSSDAGSEEFTNAITSLNEILPFAITGVNDLGLAESWLASQTDVATNSAAWLLNCLYAISGSSFNASNWTGQLAALAAGGDATAIAIQNLINRLQAIDGATINFDGRTFSVAGLGKVGGYSGGGGGGSGRGGGGGGGGGGSSPSSSSDKITEIERMLDLMEQIQKISDHNRDMIQAKQDYYGETGEIQGVIQYLEAEKKHILQNNQVLEENIQKIEESLEAQKKKVAAMSVTDSQYEQEASDLEAQQDTHQEYTKELIDNRTALVELTKEIEDQRKAIRDMEIELRETIYQAIEDREELEERMLGGTIDVQEEILDVIRARYEEERDLAIEAAEAKIEALESEMDALDEAFQKRKELAEEEDKAAELAKLESQLARISADPTRKKEELELREQIAELRDEMAWDLAEDEVEAQKESLEKQITNLEDYIEYVEGYYEELFEHPQKLIEEMEAIMQKSDEEIIEWQKANHEEYAASTDAMREDMVNGWNEMLMDMHGTVKTYWDEVEEIIQQGDEAIIEFLKENSADYKEAGKLQAEAYVDQWKQQLDDLKNAYKQITDEMNQYSYETIRLAEQAKSAASSGGGGGGGSSGGKTSSSTKPTVTKPNSNSTANKVQTSDTNTPIGGITSNKAQLNGVNKPMAFSTGGEADYTGYAVLHGTPQKPERVLSASQTESFNNLVRLLEEIKIRVPGLNLPSYTATGSNQAIQFGDINVNVDQLSSDSDYAELAERVMEEIKNRIARESIVGGIRITR